MKNNLNISQKISIMIMINFKNFARPGLKIFHNHTKKSDTVFLLYKFHGNKGFFKRHFSQILYNANI